MNIQRTFLTFFGSSKSDKYPQSITMIGAIIMAMATIYVMGIETLSMITLAAIIISIFEINKYMDRVEEDDRYMIVIDIVIGVWIAILVSYANLSNISYSYAIGIYLFFIFVSFFLFYSWKPSTIGWIHENIKGGSGLVGSASLAGFASGFLTIVFIYALGNII